MKYRRFDCDGDMFSSDQPKIGCVSPIVRSRFDLINNFYTNSLGNRTRISNASTGNIFSLLSFSLSLFAVSCAHILSSHRRNCLHFISLDTMDIDEFYFLFSRLLSQRTILIEAIKRCFESAFKSS